MFCLLFRRLFLKLSTEGSYMFNSKFYKQSVGCTIGGTYSVTFSYIYQAKLEITKVKPMKSLFNISLVVDDVEKEK